MSSQLKVMISGGGTGGHIFPAIAIANALKRKEPAMEFLFVGALGRMEMEKVPDAGYKIEGLPIAGLQRKLTAENLVLPFKVMKSIMKARTLIKQFQPNAVVGVGGYASGPVLFAASLMGIPVVIQEQNSYAGITNKLLARRAAIICVAYDEMEKFFPLTKILVTGNPVRKDLINLKDKREEAQIFFGLDKNKKTVLAIGGSLGARTINESIAMRLKNIYDEGIQLIWQTGKNYFQQEVHDANDYADRIKVFKFIDRMDLAYAAADIVISRAGALSIAELCIAARPSILVPSPNVAEDHQTKNAMMLVKKDAAILIRDCDAKEKMINQLLSLVSDTGLQQKLSINIQKLARPNADDDIAEEVIKLIKQKKQVH